VGLGSKPPGPGAVAGGGEGAAAPAEAGGTVDFDEFVDEFEGFLESFGGEKKGEPEQSL
jgi:hypothetical protein